MKILTKRYKNVDYFNIRMEPMRARRNERITLTKWKIMRN